MAADGELTPGEMQALLEQESENEIAVQTILNSALDLVGRVRYIQEIIDCYDALVLSRGSEWAAWEQAKDMSWFLQEEISAICEEARLDSETLQGLTAQDLQILDTRTKTATDATGALMDFLITELSIAPYEYR